jgi:FKBP-type peptidyl-prolyl cis-trans isomerase SlyD
MRIEKNTVVSLRYRIADQNELIIEDRLPGDPVVYLHGTGNLLPSLEAEVEGMQAGQEKTFDIEDAQITGTLRVHVVIDHIRMASEPEIKAGKIIRRECGEKGCC